MDETSTNTQNKKLEGQKATPPKPNYDSFFTPLGQDVPAQMAQNSGQDSNNIPYSAASASGQAIVRTPTGYAYFDKKIADGTLNVADGFIARQLLGLDLTKHLTIDMNMNARVKNISVTKDYDTLAGLANTGALGLKAQSLAKSSNPTGLSRLNPARWNENASIVGGTTRWIYDNVTSALPMTQESIRFGTAAKQFENNQAINVLSDGRATNYDKERAKEMYGSKLRDVKEYSVVVGEGIGAVVTKMDTIISNLQAKGENVPFEIFSTRNYYDAIQKSLISDAEKFDLQKFNKEYVDKTGDVGRFVIEYVKQLQGN